MQGSLKLMVLSLESVGDVFSLGENGLRCFKALLKGYSFLDQVFSFIWKLLDLEKHISLFVSILITVILDGLQLIDLVLKVIVLDQKALHVFTSTLSVLHGGILSQKLLDSG